MSTPTCTVITSAIGEPIVACGQPATSAIFTSITAGVEKADSFTCSFEHLARELQLIALHEVCDVRVVRYAFSAARTITSGALANHPDFEFVQAAPRLAPTVEASPAWCAAHRDCQHFDGSCRHDDVNHVPTARLTLVTGRRPGGPGISAHNHLSTGNTTSALTLCGLQVRSPINHTGDTLKLADCQNCQRSLKARA